MYDPISQEEYYQFRAIFEPHDIRTDPWPTGGAGVRVFDAKLDAATYLFQRGDERKPDESQRLSAAIPQMFGTELDVAAVALPAESYYPGLWPSIRNSKRDEAKAKVTAAQKEVDAQAAKLAALPSLESLAQSSEAADSLFAPAEPLPFTEDGGQWERLENGFRQNEVATARQNLVATRSFAGPTRVTTRFKITGGNTYHSVGIAFHGGQGSDDDSVYLSAHGPDPKIQVAHGRGGQSTYPAKGKKSFPVKLNEWYRLDVLYNETQLSVFVNGQLELSYALPEPRRRRPDQPLDV